MDPQQEAIAREFDSYRNSYEETVNEAIGFTPFKVDFFVRAKAEHLKRAVDAHFGAGSEVSILDVGCGVGQYHGLIRDRFSRISGVDVSTEAIDRARGVNPGVDYHAYPGDRLPFDDGAFDCAYAICVLHHVPVPQWESFVAEMRRVLRPGGLALLFEHNPRNPLTMKAVNDCPFDRDAVLVKPERARQLFEHAGFGDIAVEHILTIPAVSGLPKAVDRLAGHLHFGTQYCLSARA
jgi:SAM-dependent methyltransferase